MFAKSHYFFKPVCLLLMLCFLIGTAPVTTGLAASAPMIFSPANGVFLEYAKPVTLCIQSDTVPTVSVNSTNLSGGIAEHGIWKFSWTPNTIGIVTVCASVDGITDTVRYSVGKTYTDESWNFSSSSPLVYTNDYLADFASSAITYDTTSVKLSNRPSFRIQNRTNNSNNGILVYSYTMSLSTDNDGTEFVLSHRSADGKTQPLLRLKNGTAACCNDTLFHSTYTKQTPFTVTALFDMESKTYQIYLDSVCIHNSGLPSDLLSGISGMIWECSNQQASSVFQSTFYQTEIRCLASTESLIAAPSSGSLAEVGQITEIRIPETEVPISSVALFANGIRIADGIYHNEDHDWVSSWIPNLPGSYELVALVTYTDGTQSVSDSIYLSAVASEVLASCNFTVSEEHDGALYIPHGKQFWNIQSGEIVDETMNGNSIKATRLSSDGTATMDWQFATRSSYDFSASGSGNHDTSFSDGALIAEWSMKSDNGRLELKESPSDSAAPSEVYLDSNHNLGYCTSDGESVSVATLGNDWYRIKLLLNLNTRTKSVYLNGTCVAENIPISDDTLSDGKLSGIRFHASSGAVLLSDIQIRRLSGSATEAPGTLVFTSPTASVSELGDEVLLGLSASEEIQSVAFYLDDTFLAQAQETSAGSGTFLYHWTPAATGTFTITAKANNGKIATLSHTVCQYEWEETDTKLDFNALPTHAEPYGMLPASGTELSVEIPDASVSDKSVKVSKLSQESYVDIPMIASAPNMVLSFDYRAADAKTSRKVSMIGLAEDGFSFVESSAFTIQTTGAVVTPSGDSIATLNLNTTYSFDLLYHYEANTYDICLNGNPIAQNLAMTYQAEITGGETSLVFTTPKRLRFTAVGSGNHGSFFYLDNIHFYDSAVLRDEHALTAEPFNSSSVSEKTAQIDTATVSQNLNFNDETAGKPSDYALQCPIVNENNKSEIEAFPSASDKSYLLYKPSGTGDTSPYVDFAMDTENAEYTIVEFDIYMKYLSGKSFLEISIIDDIDRKSNQLSSMSVSGSGSSGVYIACTGGKGTNYSANNWHHVRMILNNQTMCTESFEVDGSVLSTNASWSEVTQGPAASIRFSIHGRWTNDNGGIAKINIDNLHIYNGKTIKTQAELDAVGKGLGCGLIQKTENILPLMENSVVLIKGTKHASANGIKTDLACAAADMDGVTYIPAVYVTESLGGSVSVSGSSVTLTLNGKKKTAAYTEKDSVKMIPLSVFSELLPSGTVTESSELDMIFLSNEAKSLTDLQMQDIFDYTMYRRPSIDTVKQDYQNTSAGQHPRVLANADTFTQILNRVQTDDTMNQWYHNVITESENILNGTHTAATSVIASLSEARVVLRRAYTLGMAYQLTKDTRYAAWMAEEMRIVCNFTDWYETETALIMGETAAAAAFTYDWFYDYLTVSAPDVKSMIEQAVYDHALIGAKNCYDLRVGTSTRWVKDEGNINIVTNSGTLLAAIAMLDTYPDLGFEIIGRAMESIENGLIGYVPDGVWKEGPSYWSYATGYLGWMMAGMQTAFGTDYGYLSENPFALNAGYYGSFMQTARGKNNVGDAGGEIENCEEVFYLAKLSNDGNLMRLRLNDMNAYNIDGSAMDLLFYDPTLCAETDHTALDQLFGDMAVFRDSYSTQNPTYASLHAGYNNGSHTHLDAGTFLLDMFDRRWAQELGHDDYNQSYYWNTTKHAYLYRLSAQGQNVLAMNPTAELGQALEATASFTDFASGNDGGYAVVDMTSVYGSRVNNAKRAIKMDHNRTQVVIQDEIDFLARKTDLYWFMYTYLGYTISPDGKSVLLTYGAGQKDQVLMVLDCNDPSAKFERANPTPLAESGVRPSVNGINGSSRLQIHIPDAGGQLTLSVRFIPVADAANADIDAIIQSATPTTPICEWVAE